MAFLGARFWGQVQGSSGRLGALRGKGAASGETTRIAGKPLYQTRFAHRIAGGRSLHGKEGVDASSPSEGSAKAPLTLGFLFRSVCRFPRLQWVWSPLWSLQVENGVQTGGLAPVQRACRSPSPAVARSRSGWPVRERTPVLRSSSPRAARTPVDALATAGRGFLVHQPSLFPCRLSPVRHQQRGTVAPRCWFTRARVPDRALLHKLSESGF